MEPLVVDRPSPGSGSGKSRAAPSVPHAADVAAPEAGLPAIGVAIVTYASADVIAACLESLFAADHPDLTIVVCDNASPDDTVKRIRHTALAAGRAVTEAPADGPPWPLDGVGRGITLLRRERNAGFAAGVNACLSALLAERHLDLFWILNPDCAVAPDAPRALARTAAAAGPFGLIAGRTLYRAAPHRIQSDGGRLRPLTLVVSQVNQGALPDAAAFPDPATLDFVSGANLVASRTFVERAGFMREDYFLYFEEVDWALRRGNLPIVACPEARVFHEGGTAIGSGRVDRRASAFANYFNYRNRIRFAWRFRRLGLPGAYAYALAKAVQLSLLGAFDEAVAILAGTHQLPPPRAIARRLAARPRAPSSER